MIVKNYSNEKKVQTYKKESSKNDTALGTIMTNFSIQKDSVANLRHSKIKWYRTGQQNPMKC